MADRRPIKARDWKIIQGLAAVLIRAQASPNGISVAGMLAALLGGGALAMGTPLLWVVGAVLIQLRLLANLLDGMVALGRGVASPVCEFYNEVPDRVSDSAILIGLGWGVGAVSLGTGAALAAMATAYIRVLGKSAGAPMDFRGPMAKQQRMALVTLVTVVCAVVPLYAPPLIHGMLWGITVLSVWTAGRRLLGSARAVSP